MEIFRSHDSFLSLEFLGINNDVLGTLGFPLLSQGCQFHQGLQRLAYGQIYHSTLQQQTKGVIRASMSVIVFFLLTIDVFVVSSGTY